MRLQDRMKEIMDESSVFICGLPYPSPSLLFAYSFVCSGVYEANFNYPPRALTFASLHLFIMDFPNMIAFKICTFFETPVPVIRI